MSTSLKVVSMAAVCWASTRRWAMRWRRGLMRSTGGRGGGGGCGGCLGLGDCGCARGSGLGGGCGGCAGGGLLVDARQDLADLDGVAGLDLEAHEHARGGGGDFERDLVGLDLDDALVALHELAVVLQPACDHAARDALAGLGHRDINGHRGYSVLKCLHKTKSDTAKSDKERAGGQCFAVDLGGAGRGVAAGLAWPLAIGAPVMGATASLRISSCVSWCSCSLPLAGLARKGRPM
jgi:hypothetical protein